MSHLFIQAGQSIIWGVPDNGAFKAMDKFKHKKKIERMKRKAIRKKHLSRKNS